MYKLVVFLTYGLIFLAVIIIGVAGKFNPAAEEIDASYGMWYLTLGVFNLIVLIAAYLQWRIRSVWLFLISIVGLIVLFFLIFQYIYPYVLE